MDLEDPVIDSSDEQNISIDRLEDAIIDHPSANAGLNQFSDESFQHKLNERANQIQQESEWSSDPNNPYSTQNTSSSSYPALYTKPNFIYEYSDFGDLRVELNQWFVTSDFMMLGLEEVQSAEFNVSFDTDLNSSPQASLIDLWQVSGWLDRIFYHVLGEYRDISSEQEQVERIMANCRAVISSNAFDDIVDLLNRALESCSLIIKEESVKPLTEVFSVNYFKLLTIVYFCLSTILATEDAPLVVLRTLQKHDILSTIVRFMEIWKISFIPHLRMRNCLLLQWKLMLVEFGDSKHLALVDEYLNERYDVKNRERKQKLVCSRVDYFTFEEDLSDKYPMRNDAATSSLSFEEKQSNMSLSSLSSESLPLCQEKELFMASHSHSGSQSNFIEVPRTNKTHSVYGTLPGQTVHIATPVPSPPSTSSEFMAGGEKVRKSYHVNQGLPFIYPVEASPKPSENTQRVPEAIREASDLIKEGVHESYSNKRFSHECALLREKEMGGCRVHEAPQVYCPTSSFPASSEKYSSVVRSLERVEFFYKNVLKNMRGFIDVLMGVLKSSKIDISLIDIEKELDPKSSFINRFGCGNAQEKIPVWMKQQLDILRAKEITLKAVSAILILTLRWFKKSHPIKAYYFSTVLFDAQFPSVFVEFLDESFNNPALQNHSSENKGIPLYDILSAQNRLRNPCVSNANLEFFSVCNKSGTSRPETFNLVNKTGLITSPITPDDERIGTEDITKFNHDFCFILVNLLNVTNKILIKIIPQRIFTFNQSKPTSLLKLILLNFVNDALRTPILKIFKKLIPYHGRKWRALNMDVVSLIYLHLKLSMRDNWLSGRDLENEFRDSFEQEMAFRSLLQFYNGRNYPNEVFALGYATSGV